jgi:hypothetical protein
MCVLLSMSLSLEYIIAHAEHDCTGAHCPVCAVLHIAQNLLGGLCVFMPAFWILAAPHARMSVPLSGSAPRLSTLSRLKVKLNR